jgi:MoaA/NifB/PqqE/SkfB family radical SAM enzyme
MGFLEFKNIIDSIANFDKNIRINFYFFGEVFVNQKALAMIGYAKNVGLKMEFSTNLLMLDEEKICNWLAMLNEDDTILLSLDAFGKDLYEKMRVGGNYERMIENFKWILREHTRKKNKPTLILQGVFNWIPEKFGAKNILPTKEISHVNEFLNLILKETWSAINKSYNDERISDFINSYKDQYKEGHLIKQICDKVIVYIKDVDDWAGQMGDRAKLNTLGDYQKNCDFPWKMMVVQSNGDITVCCKDHNGSINIGNAFKEDLKDIWNGEKIQALRQDFLDVKRNEICKHC